VILEVTYVCPFPLPIMERKKQIAKNKDIILNVSKMERLARYRSL